MCITLLDMREVSIALSYYIYTMKAVGLRWIINFVP